MGGFQKAVHVCELLLIARRYVVCWILGISKRFKRQQVAEPLQRILLVL
jgi:hypothetical protein